MQTLENTQVTVADEPRKRKPRKAGRSKRVAMEKDAIKRLRLVAVAYSHVKTAWFPTRPEDSRASVAPSGKCG